jgi:hypothetical protein
MWRILILVSLTGNSHSHPEWDISDSLGPHVFVQPGVNSNIWRPHHLLGKFLDFLDGPWCPSLETTGKEQITFIQA